MQDRIPTKPGRVAVYDEDGNFLRYEIHVRADEPTQEGDPLNKEKLLTDLTCDVLNIPRTSVPDDAFLNLALGTYKYVYVVTAKTNTGRTLSGITIKGIVNRFGQPAVTDSNGVVVGFSDSPSVTLIFTSDFIDVKTKTQRVTNTGVLTQVDFIVDAIGENTTVTIDTSKSIRFSKPVRADIHLVGAGYDGEDGQSGGGEGKGGNGGDSGYQYFKTDIPIDTNPYSAVIGAVNGSNTTFKGLSSYNGTNERGGNADDFFDPQLIGESSTTKLFGTGSVVAGGAGGKGAGYYAASDNPGNAGGSPYGGSGGASEAYGTGHNGVDGRGYGGGAGGGGAGRNGKGKGGKGYQGVMFIRWRYL